MTVRAWILVPFTGSGQAQTWTVPDYTVEELRALGWTVGAVREARDLDGELVLLTWYELVSPQGETIRSGGMNKEPAEVLEWLRQEACHRLATPTGTDDPYRPEVPSVPGVLGWADQTSLPPDAEMLPDPNIAVVEVLCQDESVVDALEDAGAVIWYVEPEPEEMT